MKNIILNKEEQKKADNDFRYYCSIFYSSEVDSVEEQDAWTRMWDLVYIASSAAVKSKLKGVKVPDIDGLILDTASNVMKSLKKRKEKNEPLVLQNKLVTLCSPYSLYPLYQKQKQFEERCISLNEYTENNGDGCLGTYNEEWDR